MKALALAIAGCALLVATPLRAQSPEAERLDAMSKKLDELNAKIDALSQELLKVEQHLANTRPGVMIGEPTPAPAPAQAQPQPSAAAAAAAAGPAASGNTHTIAKGETLTSIAKMHKVTIDELQKANHIENDRKLQVGQTLIIPAPAGSASPPTSAAPNTP